MYDSLFTSTVEEARAKKLSDAERLYVLKRYPKLRESNIHFCVMRSHQPDFIGCGVYAIAFMFAMLHNRDPAKIQFADNQRLRNHLVDQVLVPKMIVEFPRIG